MTDGSEPCFKLQASFAVYLGMLAKLRSFARSLLALLLAVATLLSLLSYCPRTLIGTFFFDVSQLVEGEENGGVSFWLHAG